MKLKITDGIFSVCKVFDYSLVNTEGEYVFTGATPEEKSLVCRAEDVPQNAYEQESGFKCFFIEGVLDFSLTGILAGITAVLADNKIAVFAASTFNTDYIFVKEADFNRAVNSLKAAGYEFCLS